MNAFGIAFIHQSRRAVSLLLLLSAAFFMADVQAQEVDCSDARDWNGKIDVNARFMTANGPVSIMARVCRIPSAAMPAWGVMRYLSDEQAVRQERYYVHAECVKVFDHPARVVVMAGRMARAVGAAETWMVVDLHTVTQRIRVRNMAAEEARRECNALAPPSLFPAAFIDGTISVE